MATIKSIEEKAKAYDEALRRARKLKEDPTSVFYEYSPSEGDTIADYIFPELKESEDERVRKELLSFFTERAKYTEDSTFNGLSSKEIISWLEDQDEHAKFRDSIQIGDEVTRNEDGVLVNLTQLKRVAKQEKLTEFEKAVKQVMEEAIECGDTRNLKADAEMLLSLVHKSAWSEDDELHIRELESLVKQVWTTAEHENDKDTIHKMSDLSFFLKTLKPQPKQEWSEEDEYCRHQLIVFCENCMVKDEGAKKCAHWLKALKPQNT